MPFFKERLLKTPHNSIKEITAHKKKHKKKPIRKCIGFFWVITEMLIGVVNEISDYKNAFGVIAGVIVTTSFLWDYNDLLCYNSEYPKTV